MRGAASKSKVKSSLGRDLMLISGVHMHVDTNEHIYTCTHMHRRTQGQDRQILGCLEFQELAMSQEHSYRFPARKRPVNPTQAILISTSNCWCSLQKHCKLAVTVLIKEGWCG